MWYRKIGVQYLKAEKISGIPGLQWYHITAPGTIKLSELKCQGQFMRAVFPNILTSLKC